MCRNLVKKEITPEVQCKCHKCNKIKFNDLDRILISMKVVSLV